MSPKAASDSTLSGLPFVPNIVAENTDRFDDQVNCGPHPTAVKVNGKLIQEAQRGFRINIIAGRHRKIIRWRPGLPGAMDG